MLEKFKDVYEFIVDLGKRRGLFWSSYEVYGGVAGFYDFGPVGVLIKRNIMNEWIKFFIQQHSDFMVEVETPIVTPKVVLQASGHEEHFTDPVVECKRCGRVFRADHLIEESAGFKVEGLSLDELDRLILEKGVKCPDCGGELGRTMKTVLLFRTEIGPYKGSPAYIRPEAAQGMFTSFKQVLNATRFKLPLGIAQIGRVCRNEISPRQGLIRLREFTIMEFEFFFDPSKAYDDVYSVIDDETLREEMNILLVEDREAGVEKPKIYTTRDLIETGAVKTPWLAYWLARGNIFVKNLGVKPGNIRFEEKGVNERAHYSAQTFDQLVHTSRFGWIEVAGYSYRTNYDLERHMEYSGADLTFFKKYDKPVERTVRKITPIAPKIKEIVGDRVGVVLSKLSSLDEEKLIHELNVKGYVEVEGFRINKECFVVKESVERIHGEKIVPHVVEPSFGLERLFYVVLENSLYFEENRVVLVLKPCLAPYQVAVFPLLTSGSDVAEKMVKTALKIHRALLKKGIWSYYDDEGSIGRRYARADEIGIPYALTVDHQTLEDYTVTIRFRDTKEQIRVRVDQLYAKLLELLGYKTTLTID